MPHKHKRRQNDSSIYDLPPNLIAKPLPVRNPNEKPKKFIPKSKSKSRSNPKIAPKQSSTTTTTASASSTTAIAAASRRKSALDDDMPRAFRHLMQAHQKHQEAARNKKRKRATDDDDEENSQTDSDSDKKSAPAPQTGPRKQPSKKNTKSTSTSATASETKAELETTKRVEIPKILPGEKLSDFAARVDREMPISEMKRSSKPTAADLPNVRETRQTKHEKHLRRLQRQWREDDVKIKEKEAAEREERETEMEEQLELWKAWEAEGGKRKAKKKGAGGGASSKTQDPWAQLKKKRESVNPFEQVQAPPQLKKPREVFKVRGGAKVDVANVPAAVGSLRRREELANERRNIVEEYRKLMASKRQ